MDWGIGARAPRAKVAAAIPTQSSELVPHGETLAVLTLTLVMVAAFGPYTPIAGARTEQLAVYGCVVLALPLSWMRIRLTPHGSLFLVLWSIYIAVAAIGILVPLEGAPWSPGNVAGGADNLLRPIGIFLLASLWVVTTVDRERLVRLACKIVIGAMCVNTVLAFIESRVDITQWLSLFWSSLTEDVQSGTVAGRAAQLGRLTGIVNQPVEAGTLYGIAILAALYLWRQRAWRLTTVLVLLTAGGTLTVSKIFLFGALPIAAWQFLRLKENRPRRFKVAAFAALAASLVAITGLLPEWTGSRFLLRLTAPTGDYLTFFSAGRFGSDSTLLSVVNTVLSISPLTGFGLGGLAVPYDNGWIQALVFAGLIGVVVYTAVLFILVRAWWVRRKQLARAESSFAGGLVLLTIGASAGFPALTGNRVATVLWVFLTLTLLVPLRSRTLPSGGGGGLASGA